MAIKKHELPSGMKFMGAYEYKDRNGKNHSHRYYTKGIKMTDPIVVYIDEEIWRAFRSFTKARQAAINHIKSL